MNPLSSILNLSKLTQRNLTIMKTTIKQLKDAGKLSSLNNAKAA